MTETSLTQDDRIRITINALWKEAHSYQPEDNKFLLLIEPESAAITVLALLDELDLLRPLPSE